MLATTFVDFIIIFSSSVEDSVGFAADMEEVNPNFWFCTAITFTAAFLGVRSIGTFRVGYLAILKLNSFRVAFVVAAVFMVFTTPVVAIDNFFIGVVHVVITNSVVM